MNKILCENLFLIEFLVDNINLIPYCVPQEIENCFGETCVSFQFLDKDPLDVCEADFKPRRDFFSLDSCNLKTKNGKSCLFAMSEQQAEKAKRKFLINIKIYKRLLDGTVKLMGTTEVAIEESFDDLLNELLQKQLKRCGRSPEENGAVRTIKGAYPFYNPKEDRRRSLQEAERRRSSELRASKAASKPSLAEEAAPAEGGEEAAAAEAAEAENPEPAETAETEEAPPENEAPAVGEAEEEPQTAERKPSQAEEGKKPSLSSQKIPSQQIERRAIGHISIFIRLSCFGRMIVTQFQMNIVDKSVAFKDKEGSTLYKYKKSSTCAEEPPPCPTLTMNFDCNRPCKPKTVCFPCPPDPYKPCPGDPCDPCYPCPKPLCPPNRGGGCDPVSCCPPRCPPPKRPPPSCPPTLCPPDPCKPCLGNPCDPCNPCPQPLCQPGRPIYLPPCPFECPPPVCTNTCYVPPCKPPCPPPYCFPPSCCPPPRPPPPGAPPLCPPDPYKPCPGDPCDPSNPCPKPYCQPNCPSYLPPPSCPLDCPPICTSMCVGPPCKPPPCPPYNIPPCPIHGFNFICKPCRTSPIQQTGNNPSDRYQEFIVDMNGNSITMRIHKEPKVKKTDSTHQEDTKEGIPCLTRCPCASRPSLPAPKRLALPPCPPPYQPPCFYPCSPPYPPPCPPPCPPYGSCGGPNFGDGVYGAGNGGGGTGGPGGCGGGSSGGPPGESNAQQGGLPCAYREYIDEFRPRNECPGKGPCLAKKKGKKGKGKKGKGKKGKGKGKGKGKKNGKTSAGVLSEKTFIPCIPWCMRCRSCISCRPCSAPLGYFCPSAPCCVRPCSRPCSPQSCCQGLGSPRPCSPQPSSPRCSPTNCCRPCCRPC